MWSLDLLTARADLDLSVKYEIWQVNTYTWLCLYASAHAYWVKLYSCCLWIQSPIMNWLTPLTHIKTHNQKIPHVWRPLYAVKPKYFVEKWTFIRHLFSLEAECKQCNVTIYSYIVYYGNPCVDCTRTRNWELSNLKRKLDKTFSWGKLWQKR